MSESNAGTSAAVNTEDREIVLTRVFDAPRELVWKAWTDPQQVVQWWGPKGFTTTIHMMEVKPGGVWRHTMHGPDGTDYPNKCVFIEVVKLERIVYSHSGGKKGDPGAQFEVTWTFQAQGNKTKLTLRMVFPSAAARENVVKTYGAMEGGKQTLERLSEHLAKTDSSVSAPAEREIVLTRVFDAPRALVFKAWTDPKLMAQWWGPKGFTNPICELDPRVGGTWRIVMRTPDGHEYPCDGVYREIVKPERLVFTNIARDKDGNPVIDGLTTVTFTEHDGKTTLTLRTRGTAVVDYAAAYLLGMETGWTQSLERLAQLVAKS
jgi:uncharacterized protein YndB with AHSA1/START domain